MKDISPFMAEMRRRLWMCVVHLDILISAQVGMPTMVPLSNANTQPPRNLRNDDLDEDTTELPASRPLDHLTILSLPLAQNALVSVCGRIALYLQDENVPSNIVTELDHDLKIAWEAVPDSFRVHPFRQSLTDPSHVIMWFFAVEHVYWTSLLLLHRKHVFTSYDIAGHEPKNKGSDPHGRDCIEAALKLSISGRAVLRDPAVWSAVSLETPCSIQHIERLFSRCSFYLFGAEFKSGVFEGHWLKRQLPRA